MHLYYVQVIYLYIVNYMYIIKFILANNLYRLNKLNLYRLKQVIVRMRSNKFTQKVELA